MGMKADSLPVGGYVALVVDDIDAARDALVAKGIAVIDVQMLEHDLSPGPRLLFYKDHDGKGGAAQEAAR
jgi:hypothetical protein